MTGFLKITVNVEQCHRNRKPLSQSRAMDLKGYHGLYLYIVAVLPQFPRVPGCSGAIGIG